MIGAMCRAHSQRAPNAEKCAFCAKPGKSSPSLAAPIAQAYRRRTRGWPGPGNRQKKARREGSCLPARGLRRRSPTLRPAPPRSVPRAGRAERRPLHSPGAGTISWVKALRNPSARDAGGALPRSSRKSGAGPTPCRQEAWPSARRPNHSFRFLRHRRRPRRAASLLLIAAYSNSLCQQRAAHDREVLSTS